MVSTIRDHLREAEVVHRRLIMVMLLTVALVAIVVMRLYFLQISERERFTDLAQQNRANTYPIPPVRGLIYDRNGHLLARNVRQYQIWIQPNQVKDMDALLDAIRARVTLSDEDLEHFRKKVRRRPGFEAQLLKSDLDEAQAARFSAIQHRLQGARLEAILKREYPEAELTSHVVGYVGRINQEDQSKIDERAYGGTQHIGKLGIEKSYEQHLLGEVGSEAIETNAHGRRLRTLDRVAPESGQNIYLSLDIELQRFAQSLLKDYEGAAVAIDPRNGEILAFVSEPGYDTNPFVDGISNKDYQMLRNSDRRPLFNRALNGRYAPGSTIKGFVGLVADKYHAHIGSAYCPGWYSLPSSRHRYRCWKHVGHGQMGLHDAIVQSCDVYFYDQARRLGIDHLSEGMQAFGFGQLTNIDVPHEPSALMPTQAWKKKTQGRVWYPGETVITGIGQGYMLVTPIQLANAVATLANRGHPVQPHFVTSIQDTESGQWQAVEYPRPEPVKGPSLQTYDLVIRAMRDVVHGERGTARAQGIGLPFEIAGKTGTAQVKSIAQGARYDAENTEKKYRDHSLFVAFAPVEAPRIAIAVIVEHGGSGSKVAAPIARQIVEYYLVDRLGLYSREVEDDIP